MTSPGTRRVLPRTVVVLACAALFGSTAALPAAADPTTPSQAQVDAARAAASGVAGQVAAVQAQLAAAAAQLEDAQVRASQAAEEFDAAQEELASRTAAAQQAQQQAATARDGVRDARNDVGRLAAASYRSGGSLTDVSGFLSADGPQDLLDRAALLDAVSKQQDRKYQKMDAAQTVAGLMDDQAQVALAQEQQAAAAADAARQSAQAASDGALAQVTSTQSAQDQLVAQLAQLQHTSVALAQQRQDGLAREAQQRAEAAARADLARRQAAARAQADQAARAASANAPRAPTTTGRSARPRATSARASTPTSPAQTTDATDATDGSQDPTGQVTAPSGSSHGSTSAGQAAVAWARTQLGKPYLWGATGPDSYDCSGLTGGAWRAAGISLPRTSREQYARVQKISYDDLRPGDLIFYGSDPDVGSTIYHLAMYAGNGKMLEAPHAGADVREVSVRYSSAMTWAGRP